MTSQKNHIAEMAAPKPLQMQAQRHPSVSSLHLAGKAMVRLTSTCRSGDLIGEYTHLFTLVNTTACMGSKTAQWAVVHQRALNYTSEHSCDD